MKWRSDSGPVVCDAGVLDLGGDDASLALGLDAGSSSSSPRISASSSSATSTSRVCWPSPSPALPLAGLAWPWPELGPGVALALPDPALLLVAELEVGDVDGGHGNGDDVLPLLAEHLALLDVLLEVLLDLPADDLRKRAWSCLILLRDMAVPLPSQLLHSFASPRAKMLAT